MADILGRRAERDAVEELLAGVRAGRSGVSVVRGEAGIGKSALLEHVRDGAAASGFRVEGSVGVESEANFAFAGLHQLCAPMLDRAGALPEPQQAALGVALGQRDGPAPDGFLVGLATLNLLCEIAEERPLLCLIDDVQWLDQASAQVMAFVARRVAAERVALIFGLRDPVVQAENPFAGLPELRLEGLGDIDARALLADVVHAPLDDSVRDRIVAEARGNPLALSELSRHVEPVLLAGGFERPDLMSVPQRVEDSFQRRSTSLPGDTQMLLLVAAAEPTGDAELLWRAGEHLGISRRAAEPAEAAGLVEIHTRVRFHHPLVRSAVYQAATLPDQRRAHAALAAATDPQLDPDRRAWHRAQAVQGTDEDAAADLEQSADRARARGGLAAAAAFLQQAVALTPDPAVRARRALDAAHAKHDAGAAEAALELLTVAAVGPLDVLQRARLELLRAHITMYLERSSNAPGMLLDAARTLAPLDATLARETYLHALDSAVVTGGAGPGLSVSEVADAARAAPAPPGPPGLADLLLEGLVTTFTQGYEAGVPGLRRALEAFRGEEPHAGAGSASDGHRWLWLVNRTAVALFDDELIEQVYVLADRDARHAREVGSMYMVPVALLLQSTTSVLTGDLTRAADLAAEGAAITEAIGAMPMRHTGLLLAAWRGRQAETIELYTASVQAGAVGTEVSTAQYALAVLHNGHGNYRAALDAAAQGCESIDPGHVNLALPELVEAAARAEQHERAAIAMKQLHSRARASGTQWALGLAARSRALTSTGPDAELSYREAIERLGDSRMTTQLARAHLVYGEWLRRERRRQDAREQLRTAHQLLSDKGADAFAERAAHELRATGEHPRKRTTQPTDALTTHELHIARLVATGATNREVGEQLFLSPRTIEAHLRSIFRKLDITSRRQLKDLELP